MANEQAGQLILADYRQNMGGLNVTDGALTILPSQATGGQNYEYVRTGGFTTSKTPRLINSTSDAETRSRGFGLLDTKSNVKTLIRMATTQFQSVNISGGSMTALSEDTASAGTSFFTGSTQTSSAMFTTSTIDTLWTVGGGLSRPYGPYSSSKVTKNGSDVATGSFSAVTSLTGGSWAATGTYYYAIALRKAATQAISNAGLDVSATIANTTDKITLNFTGLTGLDTTKYDQIVIYRSSVGGVSAFTAGVIVTTIASTTTSYVDTGSATATSQNIPRAGNTLLDNSVLPTGTYETLVAFKQRLVTASDSTVYLSDINKPESWPTTNTIVIPSGGKITGLAKIGFNHPGGSSTDEFLAIFKEKELWIITGNDSSDWELKFVDYTGCAQQNLIVSANGFLSWIDIRGVYLWDGAGKPTYASRPIEQMFSISGHINKSLLSLGSGSFFREQNQIIWYLSSNIYGEQQYCLKLDLRLTLPQVKNFLGERVLEGVFLQGRTTNPIYASAGVLSPETGVKRDLLIIGDSSGFIYKAFDDTSGSGQDVNFQYETAHLDQDRPSIAKRYHKVIVYVDNIGNWDLGLDYWTDFRVREEEKSTLTQAIGTTADSQTPIWDLGEWDEARWDDVITTLRPIVFNLPPGSSQNNNEGDAIKLRFYNANSGEPITINAFSILYSVIGVRK